MAHQEDSLAFVESKIFRRNGRSASRFQVASFPHPSCWLLKTMFSGRSLDAGRMRCAKAAGIMVMQSRKACLQKAHARCCPCCYRNRDRPLTQLSGFPPSERAVVLCDAIECMYLVHYAVIIRLRQRAVLACSGISVDLPVDIQQ